MLNPHEPKERRAKAKKSWYLIRKMKKMKMLLLMMMMEKEMKEKEMKEKMKTLKCDK